MTTIAEEGNRRLGEMTLAELEQCIFDIKAWFGRVNKDFAKYSSASRADLEKLQKSIDCNIPQPIEHLLVENDGSIYIFDKKLMSSREIADYYPLMEKSPGWKSGYMPFCGTETEALVVDSKERVFEWDADDGVGTELSPSLNDFLEGYRNLLLSGAFEFISGIGVVETRSVAPRNFPVSLVEDSALLLALQEDDDGISKNLSGERMLSAIHTVSPMYENAGYERVLDEDALVSLLEELSYLGCARLEEVLVMTHFKGESWQRNIIGRLNDDLQRYASSMKYESTEIRTYIGTGMLSALKRYMLHNSKVSKDDFKLSCSNGHLSVAQWLYGLGGVDIHADDDFAFRNACRIGHRSVAEWLYGLGGVDIHVYSDAAFRTVCGSGHLSVAEWLYGLGGVDIQVDDDYAFRYACRNGHLSVAQWLYGLGGVDIHADFDFAFRYACVNGHLSVAQWLYGLGGVNISIFKEYAFRGTCVNGHLSVAQWLYGLGGVDIHTSNDFAFRFACENGHLTVAQWLYGLGGVDINISDNYACRYAYFNNHLSILEWLCELRGVEFIADGCDFKDSYCFYEHLEFRYT